MVSDIIFDFFGTLVGYTAGVFPGAPYERTHQLLLRHGYELSYERFVEEFTGAADALERQARETAVEYHMHEVGRKFFRAQGLAEVPEALLESFIASFIEEWSRGIVYLEGLDQLLAGLARRYRLSVLSNTHYPPLIQRNLAAAQIRQHIAEVVTSVEFGRRKPNPTIFAHLLGRLQVEPAAAIYVGDTYQDDYLGARAAGIRCILIDPDGRYPDVPERIAALAELPAYLERL